MTNDPTLPRKPVTALNVGDLVDLENDAFADTGICPEFEFELMEVEAIDVETGNCVAVYFVNGPCVGFPPQHIVSVSPKSED